MLISDSHQFIFVHNRRVAGTSMRQRLAPFAIPSPDGRLNQVLSRAGLRRNYRHHLFRVHAPIRHAQARMSPQRFQRYFKFAFVRNPWVRLVSEYEYIRRTPSHGRHKVVSQMSSLRSFIEFQIPRPDAYQWSLLVDDKQQLAMDLVGRLENLQSDFGRVCAHLGIPFEALPHLNRTAVEDYRRYYTDSDVELVRQHWRKEIEAFDYRFE